MNDLQKRSWAEISLPNLKHNYTHIRADTKLHEQHGNKAADCCQGTSRYLGN